MTGENEIQPDREDVEAVELHYGPLPANATLSEQADRYRLYQAQAMIRAYRNYTLNRRKAPGVRSRH